MSDSRFYPKGLAQNSLSMQAHQMQLSQSDAQSFPLLSWPRDGQSVIKHQLWKVLRAFTLA